MHTHTSPPITTDLTLGVTCTCTCTCAELLSRSGSSAELELLSAEFSYLDEQLAALVGRLVVNPDAPSVASSGEDLLASLANEIPDLRQRVGVP